MEKEEEEPAEVLTKSQLKKKRKQEHWEQKKKFQREQKKKRKKNKHRVSCLYKNNKEEWEKRKNEGLKVVIDCDFESYLTEKEKSSLKQQIMYCYAVNKRSEHPINLILTGVSQGLKEDIDKVSYGNWPLEMHSESYLEKFTKDDLVYLTADSENELDIFDTNRVYIIGGLVDHNRLKMITHNKAMEQGIKTTKLPILKYVKLERSTVLTVNHVAELIIKYHETGDWQVSINNAIPPRKIAKISEE